LPLRSAETTDASAEPSLTVTSPAGSAASARSFGRSRTNDGEWLVLIYPIAVIDDVRGLFGSREVDAASLGFPVWAPTPNRGEDQIVPATRYTIGDSLFGMEG
jgi:hypothetical protein